MGRAKSGNSSLHFCGSGTITIFYSSGSDFGKSYGSYDSGSTKLLPCAPAMKTDKEEDSNNNIQQKNTRKIIILLNLIS
jgi:hypothetical protein